MNEWTTVDCRLRREPAHQLAGELAHRVRKTLTDVQAIAMLTMNRATPARDAFPALLSRMAALGATNDVLTRDNWDRADLRELILWVAVPLCTDVDAAFQLDGPSLDLPPRDGLDMTMVLHELCTNALKYGALSTPGGRIMIAWSHPNGDPNALEVIWREQGGPPVQPPAGASGFGTRLIARALGEHGSTKLEFDRDGVVFRVRLAWRAANRNAAA